jgi:hypothetical protein
LFVTTQLFATPRVTAHLGTTYFNEPFRTAIQLNDLFVTSQRTPLHTAAHRAASILDASPRTNVHRISAQRNDLFVMPHRSAPRRASALRSVTRRNSTPPLAIQLNDLFVTTPRSASLRYTPLRFAGLFCDTQRSSSQFNSTICLLQCNSTQPNATRLASTRRGSTQLNELKL